MALRRSRNRRSSIRKKSNASGFLNDDTNVYEDDPLWFNRTVIRPSTSIIMTRNDSSILNPDSTVDVSKLSPNWHKNLSQSNSSKLMAQAVQKNISDRLNNEQSDSSRADPTTESESEHESQKRRANFRAHQAKSNKSEKSNIFLKALEETTESHTRNLKNYTTAQESESEHEYEKKRTKFRLQQRKGDKSEKSNIFLRALEETTDSHTRTLIAQTSKDQESESTHDESTSSRRLRPKLFQTPNSPVKRLRAGQTSKINESKSIHDESTSSKRLKLRSASKSVNESVLAKSLSNKSVNKEKSNAVTDDQNEKESPTNSAIFKGERSQLNDESDEENLYDGSFNRNETSKNELQRKSLKRKLESSQSQKLSTMAAGVDNISQVSQLNNESDEESLYDGSFNRSEASKNKLQSKLPTAKEIHNTVQDTSKRNSSNKMLNESKSLTKLRKSQSQNISEENNTATAHNSDEENSTMPRYIRRTQSRLFQKSQNIGNDKILDNINNESSRVKNNRTQESSKIREKNSMVPNTSQNSPNLRKRQSQATSTPNVIEPRESDEENSTMPKYIRRTKSRIFQKSQIANSGNAFDEILNTNNSTSRLSKHSEVASLQNSKHLSKSMLRDAMNLSTSLMKPRVVLTRVQNPDSSTESQKENRLAITRAKNSPSKSKRQLTTIENNQNYENLSNKPKQQEMVSIEDSQANVSRSKNSPRKSRNQTVSVAESQGDASKAKDSTRKSRNQTVSLEENQSSQPQSKNPVNEDNNEATASRSRNSLQRSKQQAEVEASDISLAEDSNDRGGSKASDSRTKAANVNARSRSNSHSSVEVSSDRTPQQQQEQGALSDSSALPSDELIHTPNPAQSTLKLSGKPLRRLTQFSFRGWEQESIIAPVAPVPPLAADLRTRIIAEESSEATLQHSPETVSRQPPEALTRLAVEAPSRHAARLSPRRSDELSSHHAARVSLRQPAEAPSRQSARASRYSTETSPKHAAEVPSRHSAEASSRHSTRVPTQNPAETLSRYSATVVVGVASDDENRDVDVINDSDSSHVSDYPLLTRQLIEIPYENDRTTDNEEPTPSIHAKTLRNDDQVDQNVSTIDKSAWAEVMKKTNALKMMMEAQMKRDRERRLKEERQKEQTAAKLKRIMAQKAAEKRKRQKKPVDKAFLVDGKVYKQPKLPRPQKWATDRLYKHLWKCMEPRYGMRTRVKSEEFVLKLANFAKIFERRKKFENYEAELEDLLCIMAKLKIINTRYDFYRFCWEFMPYNFRLKVRPMMLPGNVRNIPYNPELTNKPILASNNTDCSDSESEPNRAADQSESDSE